MKGMVIRIEERKKKAVFLQQLTEIYIESYKN